MKRKIVLLCLLCSFLCLFGCGKQGVDVSSESISFTSEMNETETLDTQIGPIESESVFEIVETESETISEADMCRNYLENVQVDVLASTVVDYEDAYINGYGVMSDAYDKATVLTLGVRLPEEGRYSDYFRSVGVSGNTATDENGETVVQTTNQAFWIDDNGRYFLILLRVGGEVDTTKASVTLDGKVDDISVTKSFSNQGQPVGFTDAIAAFSGDISNTGSYIVKLQGRHYLVANRYASSDGIQSDASSNSKSFFNKMSIILIPLEQGFGETLDKDSMKLVSPDMDSVVGELLVNESGAICATELKCQSTIELNVIYTVVETSDEIWTDELYDKIDADIERMFDESVVQIDDGDGNFVSLSFENMFS